MKKKFLILAAIITINAIAFTLTCPPKVFADGGGTYRYEVEMCLCPNDPPGSEFDCHSAECTTSGQSYVCAQGWPDIPCGDKLPEDPPPAP